MSEKYTEAVQSRSRRFLFRLGAILIGLLPFVIFELVLLGVGWQPPGSVRDPYVEFSETQPLFEPDGAGTQYAIASSRLPLFRPEQFLIEKPASEFRIFCVGGSTVQGRPYAIETSFTTWLEIRLQAADPSKRWNVINCGGVSYASYRLAPIIEEIIGYDPDLIVLYTGHNEFLEDRTYDSIKSTAPWVARTHNQLARLRTYSFLRSLALGVTAGGENKDGAGTTNLNDGMVLPPDVEARLDFRNGLEQYHRDDQWKRDVIQHFAFNVRRMVKTAKDANVPLILCNPACNLRDASPFKSENSNDLPSSDLARFTESWDSIRAIDDTPRDVQQEIDRLSVLVEIDSRHAGLQYRLGQMIQQAGDFKKAKTHLIRAKEEDVCPLRIIEPMYDVIAEVANELDVPLVDIKAFFEKRSPDGIPGRESFLDHVHPTIHGHQLISELLFAEMVRGRWVVSPNDNVETEKRFETHLGSLPFMYFQEGKDRLAGLKRWAEGKVTRKKNK